MSVNEYKTNIYNAALLYIDGVHSPREKTQMSDAEELLRLRSLSGYVIAVELPIPAPLDFEGLVEVILGSLTTTDVWVQLVIKPPQDSTREHFELLSGSVGGLITGIKRDIATTQWHIDTKQRHSLSYDQLREFITFYKDCLNTLELLQKDFKALSVENEQDWPKPELEKM